MQVSPDSITGSRRGSRRSTRSSGPVRLEEDLSNETTEAASLAASRKPPRKRGSPVSHANEVKKPNRKKKDVEEQVEEQVEDHEEEEEEAVLPPYPLGIRIRKEFEAGSFEGEVRSGPKLSEEGAVWDVVYDDGDKEQFTLREIEEHKVEDAKPKRTPREKVASPKAVSPGTRKRNPRRNKNSVNPYTIYYEDYETAFNDMQWRMGNTEEEIKAAMKGMKPPYGLNAIQQAIHKAKSSDAYVPREKFDPHKGMRVRKHYDGSLWYGTVSCEEPEWLTIDETGEEVRMWEVTFDDNTKEDMDFDELRLCYAGRPTRANPVRGRQLCALELFCGQGTVSQEFADLKWWVRSIDNHPNSYATDIVDIMKLRFQDIGRVPDFIWASPPCHTYSNMAGGTHRSREGSQYEKTPEARKHNRLLAQMFSILRWAKSKNPHLIVAIENPVGLLQHMPLMKEITSSLGLEKAEVHYCAFGRDDKKPTYIWTNSWKLRAALNDFRCEKKCPYSGGSHPIGVRANGRSFNAAAIPQALSEEVAHNVHSTFYDLRIRHTKEVTLTEEEVEAFDNMMAI